MAHLICNWQKDVTEDWQIVAIFHAHLKYHDEVFSVNGIKHTYSLYTHNQESKWHISDLVPWYIYIESCPFLFANNVIVRISQMRPEFLMLIAVPREVEHAVKRKTTNAVSRIWNGSRQHPLLLHQRLTWDHPQSNTAPPDHDVYPSQLSTPWRQNLRWMHIAVDFWIVNIFNGSQNKHKD